MVLILQKITKTLRFRIQFIFAAYMAKYTHLCQNSCLGEHSQNMHVGYINYQLVFKYNVNLFYTLKASCRISNIALFNELLHILFAFFLEQCSPTPELHQFVRCWLTKSLFQNFSNLSFTNLSLYTWILFPIFLTFLFLFYATECRF